MSDFWGPFVFGFVWLAIALVALWLLRRAKSGRLSLRSTFARLMTWAVAVITLIIFVVDLPYSLGFCLGGFEDPVACTLFPTEIAEATSALTLLMVLAAVVVVPVLAIGALLVETLTRC